MSKLLYVLSYLHHDGSEIYWEEIFGVFDDETLAINERARLVDMQPYFNFGSSVPLYEEAFRIERFRLNGKRTNQLLLEKFDRRKNRFKKKEDR